MDLTSPVQLAYVVSDVRQAAAQWSVAHHAGPFFVAEHIPLTQVTYRGLPGSFDHSSAYGQWGAVMVELLTQHGDAPSAVRDMYAAGECGLHHVAFMVDDFDEAASRLNQRGWAPTTIAQVAGGLTFGFFDARRDLGHMVEIYPRTPELRGFYDMVAVAARGWDGTDPVRTA